MDLKEMGRDVNYIRLVAGFCEETVNLRLA
jgi:hypothetical protein